MPIRTIQHPGIQLNEIDRSQYDKVDYSLQNAPTVLTLGVASKGEDLALTWINSASTLDETYGTPTNEYERYFYNSIHEVLRRGGTAIAAKLPYANEAQGHFNYVQYDASNVIQLDCVSLLSSYETYKYDTIGDLYGTLSNIMDQLGEGTPIGSIVGMAHAVTELYEKYLPTEISSIEVIKDIKTMLENFIARMYVSSDFAALPLNDSNLTSALEVKYDGKCEKDTMQSLDGYLTHSKSVPAGKVRIYDMTRSQYKPLNSYDGCVSSLYGSTVIKTNDCLGIVPVFTTPANALFFQNVLDFSGLSTVNYAKYNQANALTSTTNNKTSVDFTHIEDYSTLPLESIPLPSSGSNGYDYPSLSQTTSQQFPQIDFNGPSHFDTTYLKCIGVTVFAAFADTSNNGKLNFRLLESFIGSFNRNAKDTSTGASLFIDDVVNSSSQFIRLFSNVDQKAEESVATYIMSEQPAASLGFYGVDCRKRISYLDTIIKPMSSILAGDASSQTALPLDIVVDAGVSNIAQLAYVSQGKVLDADAKPNVADVDWKIGNARSDISGWKAVLGMLDNFCKTTRKDCMLIADGIRSFCLDGNLKYVRKTAPQNTVANTIMPKFRCMSNPLNSSYAAGYCDWFYSPDYSSNGSSFFWCPPSIKAAGSYIYCSTYFHPWSAPAGQTRGIVNDAVDVAFTPSDADADQIYSNQWNYAVNYPIDGIVIEGHKTFQSQKTALDRVNVRRLMLDLEKKVKRIARYFLYESNNDYTRQLFVDTIRPIFEDAVAGNGISEYGIKCDEELNTPQVVDNNEMRCKIAVKPIKCVDFIVIDMIATRQSANISEELLK